MASLQLNRRDLEFLLYEYLDVERLTERERRCDHSRESFDDVLDLAEKIATEHFARWELPRTHAQLDLLDSLDTTTLDMRPGSF